MRIGVKFPEKEDKVENKKGNMQQINKERQAKICAIS